MTKSVSKDESTDENITVLGITNSSSMGWAASQLKTDDAGVQQLRDDHHHLYFIVEGPRLTPTDLTDNPEGDGWILDIRHVTEGVQTTTSVPIPKNTFLNHSLVFSGTGLTAVSDANSAQRRDVTASEVVRAALRAHGAATKTQPIRTVAQREVRYELVDGEPTLMSIEDIPADDVSSDGTNLKEDWVESIIDALFTFDVVYIGMTYGTEGTPTAGTSTPADRLRRHEKLTPAFADVQDRRPDKTIGFITINQQMTSVDRLRVEERDLEKSLTPGWVVEQFAVLDQPLSEFTVDAAESVLIGAFQPPLNGNKIKFSNTTESPKKLKEMGYSHLQVRIDLRDSFAKLRGPDSRALTLHSLTFSLETNQLENPGDTAWNQFLTVL